MVSLRKYLVKKLTLVYDLEVMKQDTDRILASDVKTFVGKTIKIQGWVRLRRDHGKLIFLDVRDRSGIIQVIVNQNVSEPAYLAAKDLRPEFAVEITGVVNERPGGASNKNLASGSVELEAAEVKVLAKAETFPFDMGSEDLDLELPTLLDHRALTLRHPKVQAIFKVQAVIIDAFREFHK